MVVVVRTDRERELDARLVLARRDLEHVKQVAGSVCPEYETCSHKWCSASHGAWEVADSALKRMFKDITDDLVARGEWPPNARCEDGDCEVYCGKC